MLSVFHGHPVFRMSVCASFSVFCPRVRQDCVSMGTWSHFAFATVDRLRVQHAVLVADVQRSFGFVFKVSSVAIHRNHVVSFERSCVSFRCSTNRACRRWATFILFCVQRFSSFAFHCNLVVSFEHSRVPFRCSTNRVCRVCAAFVLFYVQGFSSFAFHCNHVGRLGAVGFLAVVATMGVDCSTAVCPNKRLHF